MNSDYYPMGTWEGDPRAPWNEPEPECPECGAAVQPDWIACPWCRADLEHEEQYDAGFDEDVPVSRPMREIYEEMMGRMRAYAD